MEKTSTMKDVARLAGVSVGTVSRVINNEAGIKESTLEKVASAIEALHYIPDAYARGMKTSKTQTIALIVPTIWHPFFAEFAYYIEEDLSKLNYKLLLCNTDGSRKEIEYINMLQQNKVDGIIAITYSPIDDYLASGIPFVSIDRTYVNKEIPCVTSDNYSGGNLAAEKLIEHGCTKLAFLGSHNKTINETKRRRDGFEDYLVQKEKDYVIFDLEEPFTDYDHQLEQFLILNPKIDGIFAINDFTAMTAISLLEKLGKNVPEDVQVIGYDGIKYAKERHYPVTTIKQPLEKMANEAIHILMCILNNQPHEPQVILPITFEEGCSTKIVN